MIRQLQKLKAKKGFTMIELIVVIAILAVMASMIVVGLDSKKATKDEACSYSRDLYNAAQSVFTKYSLYEAPLSLELKAEDTPQTNSYIHFFKKVGGNYPCTPGTSFPDMPQSTTLFMEIVVKGTIDEVNVANSMELLLQHGDPTKDSALGELLKNDLATRMELRDGYYYLKAEYVAPAPGGVSTTTDEISTVKIGFAAYGKNRLPSYGGGGWGSFQTDNLFFATENYVLKSGQIMGVFAPWDSTANTTIGTKGTYLS